MDIRSLARHLDLSIGTVSRALNGKKDVNPATRQRVVEAAARLGYTPNQSGRSLRRGRTGAVGFMLTLDHDSATHGDQFFMGLFEGIQAGLAQMGFDLVVLLARPGEDQLEALRRSVSRGIADGWLLSATQRHDPRIDLLADLGIPFATLGRSASDGAQPWIDLDFEGLVRQAMDRFAAAGHRRIGLIAPPASVNNSFIVIDAYRSSLDAAGIPFDPRLIHQDGDDERDGEVAVRELMDLPDPPTAVLAMGETIPAGFYKGLRARGITPGRDVSVIGARANPFTEALSPTLSCFTLPLRDLGTELAHALLPYLEDQPLENLVPIRTLWPMRFVPGESEMPVAI